MRKIKASFVPALLCLAFALPASAQDQAHSPYVVADIVVIHSNILGEDRRLFVYNPDDVGGNILPAYPVLYLLEENDMPMVAGTVKYLSSYNEQIPAMLVVGIEGGDRIRDLTPTHALYDNTGQRDDSPDSWLKSSGGGDKFLQFVRDEVTPYVEKHYRTAPFKMLAGHSVGGLTSVYALTAYPQLFNGYIAVSPSLWWDRGVMLSLAGSKLQIPRARKTFLYVADCPESASFSVYMQRFLALLHTKMPAGLTFTHQFYPTETHGSIAAKAYYDGLRFLFPDWNIAETDSSATLIKEHYQRLSDRLGYSVQPPLGMVSDWGNAFLRKHMAQDAIELFSLNTHNFPKSADAHMDLGNALAASGDKAGAKDSYQKALELSPNNPDIAAKLRDLSK